MPGLLTLPSIQCHQVSGLADSGGFSKSFWSSAPPEMETEAATAARLEAETQRQLAQERLERITNGIRMKEAVLSGDSARIDQALSAGPVNATISFKAVAKPLGYQNAANQPIYRCSMFPDPSILPTGERAIAAVTYTMDHPSFKNNKMIAGPERAFTAYYDGWGCVRRVVALIEYVDPNRSPEIASFDLCALLGQ